MAVGNKDGAARCRLVGAVPLWLLGALLHVGSYQRFDIPLHVALSFEVGEQVPLVRPEPRDLLHDVAPEVFRARSFLGFRCHGILHLGRGLRCPGPSPTPPGAGSGFRLSPIQELEPNGDRNAESPNPERYARGPSLLAVGGPIPS